MSRPILIWCGPDACPESKAKGFDWARQLSCSGKRQNVRIRLENIERKLVSNLDSLLVDLLEVASYVYSADQAVPRGGRTAGTNGELWNRRFRFEIAVRNPDVWNRPDVKQALVQCLSWLSDDNYRFEFRKLKSPPDVQTYLELNEKGAWFEADEVLLFSGGLDSLAGAVKAIRKGRRVVLVSHRPVSTTSTRQIDLVKRLERLLQTKGNLLHIPVWINKDKGLTNDANQRTRTFLFGSLAAIVARMHQIDQIRFYENGIISINLPLTEALSGAQASRSTHPRSLSLMQKFFSALFDSSMIVSNPFIWKTKSEVVRVLKDAGVQELVESTVSCSHTRAAASPPSHCGVCTQCIERRVAIEHEELSELDPVYRSYRTDLFIDPIEPEADHALVAAFVQLYQQLKDVNSADFQRRFPQIIDLCTHLSLAPSQVVKSTFELYKRQADQVVSVFNEQVQRHSDLFAENRLPHNSLLGMLTGNRSTDPAPEPEVIRFPTPKNANWHEVSIRFVSSEEVEITVRDRKKNYHCFQMTFRDLRKHNQPTALWAIMQEMALNGGCMPWSIEKDPTKKVQKHVQRLRQKLRTFFGIKNSPIRQLTPQDGFVAKFVIHGRPD
jgi:7-cyano-7-deazaguanine synthase in queuosine biosynthesis